MDIVALTLDGEDKEIFLCQCTTDWKDEKINSVLATNELRQTVKSNEFNIHSILITQTESHRMNTTAAQAKGVKIITIDDLRILLKEIKDNVKPCELAKSFLI